MRYLVTGGAGFIGSHLCDHLLAAGSEVTILDDLSTGRHANIAHLIDEPSVEFVLGSILDRAVVDDVMNRCDAVFHLAAAVGVDLIVRKPLESLRTNILGSEIVLEKAHRYERPVLITSTSEVYGKNTSDALHEEDDRILGSPLKSRWSYSEAKAIDEVLAYTYWREKGLRTVIVRLFNTVGPRQTGSYGMVIPRFVNQAVLGAPITVYGSGEQTRCFCYVGDVVLALAALMDHPEAAGRVFNVGGTDEISIADLAALVVRLSGSDSKIRFVSYEDAYEEGFEDMERRVPDLGRVRELIDFRPTVDLAQVVQLVIEEQRS